MTRAVRAFPRLLAAALAPVAAALALVSPASAQTRAIAIAARPIPQFDIGSARTRFGALDYIGGFSFSSRDGPLAGLSALRLRDGGSRVLAVTDTGLWFAAGVRRDAGGRPIGFAEAKPAPIRRSDGHGGARKGEADAEGLAIDGTRALVSFERDHRVAAYLDPAAPFDNLPQPVAQPIPRGELRSNAGLETIAVSPKRSPLRGAAVVVTEYSIDEAGNLFAAILGAGGGVFTVKRDPPWHATDGAFLPDGDLLLLERRFEGFGQVGMRIRRLPGAAIRPGALVDGPVLMEADLGQEIDNMEGLDAWVGADGQVVLSLISDDNGSFLQRNLYLEFRLAGSAPESN